jgi:hypothetical protein
VSEEGVLFFRIQYVLEKVHRSGTNYVGGRSLGLYIRLISCVCSEVEGVFDQRSNSVGITREEVW